MGEIDIEGVIVTPLKTIFHPKGDIYHGIKKDDNGYLGFGEAYFSTIKYGETKGWNRHKKMTLNLIVPIGDVTFIIYDDRLNSSSKCYFQKVNLSKANYKRLTIPKGLWLAFKGNEKPTNLILNIANKIHNPYEVEKISLNKIEYNFRKL